MSLHILFPLVCFSLIIAARGDVLLAGRQASNLTGDTLCGTNMCASAIVNGSVIEYILSSTGQKQAGWMAIGLDGVQMTGTHMVVLWSNADSTITISQRLGTGHSNPQVDSNPPKAATLSNDLSSTSGATKFVFSVPIDGASLSTQDIIYAFGAQNPGSTDPGTILQEHIEFGAGRLDLTKPIPTGSTSDANASDLPVPDPSNSASGVPPSYTKLIIAHGIVTTVGFLLFLPAGVLLARYLRTFSHTWYTGHWICQFGIAGPIIVAGVALGIQSVNSAGALHLDDEHKTWGIGIFVLYFVQCALGAIIHYFKPKNLKRRPPQNYIHAVIGLTVIALAFKQVRNGINTEWSESTGLPILTGANVIWYIWVVLLPLLYAAGLFLLRRQFRQESASKSSRYQDIL